MDDKQQHRGCLIALEGIDASGTTTQARMLAERLNAQQPTDEGARPAVLTCEPSSGPIGRLLRDVVLAARHSMNPAAVALLFAADRLHHVTAVVEPALQRGVHVISDRYVYSSLAYQGAQLDQSWVFSINAKAPEPDINIYLRLSPELAQQRRTSRGGPVELYDALAQQRRIAACYDELLGACAEQATWRWGHNGSWKRAGARRQHFDRSAEVAVLDATQEVGLLHAQIFALVERVVGLR